MRVPWTRGPIVPGNWLNEGPRAGGSVRLVGRIRPGRAGLRVSWQHWPKLVAVAESGVAAEDREGRGDFEIRDRRTYSLPR